MAKKNRIGLQIDLEDIVTSIEKAGKDVRKSTEAALKASKKVVTDALVKDTVKGNYPAKGAYSTGALANSINKDYSVKWSGYTGEIKVGYDFDKAGLVSIFMMYGTPRYMKVQKIYNDFYGTKIKKEIAEIQQEALNKILQRR